jgi:hypothetical protein|tara:strand:- start:630 stop:839 length:210 start_codon:yes stop_codon:yes gene_type:complete
MQFIQRLITLLLCSSFVTLAVATTQTQMVPPEPSLRKVPTVWVGLLLILVFFGTVVVINLISSKRGHQD